MTGLSQAWRLAAGNLRARKALTLSAMVRLLRLVILAVSFSALQLTLLRGGAGCPIPTAAALHAMVAVGTSASMTGMDGMVMPTTASDIDGHSSGSEPCDQATAPQTCQTMAPCISAMLVTTASSDLSFSQAQPLLAALVIAPPSETTAPDFPPPRA